MSDRPRPPEAAASPAGSRAPRGPHDRRTLDRLLIALIVLGLLLFAVDPLVEKKPYFEVEHWLGFHGIVGAGAAALALLVARLLRLLVPRREGDHDR